MKEQKTKSCRQIMITILMVLGLTFLPTQTVNAAVTIDDVVYMTDDATKTARVNNVLVIKENMVFPDTITVDGVTYTVNKFDQAHLKGNTTLKTVKLPNGMTTFPSQMFYGCTSLESVTLPNSLKYVGNIAFSGCSNLTHIELPDTVISILTSAFYGSGLREIELPSGVTVIHDYAFKDCKNLTDIKLSDSLTEVGKEVFMGCSGLTEIKLPAGVTTIGSSVFDDCSNLTTIELPQGLTTIHKCAFRNCSKLSSLVIPPNVTASNFESGEGGENTMFYGTSMLETIYYPSALKDKISAEITSNTATTQIGYVVNENQTVSLTIDVLGTNVRSITLPESIYGMPIASVNANGKEVTVICSKHYNQSGYDKDENKHWLGACAVCGDVESDNHSFANGNTACVCGYVPFDIEGHPMGGALIYGYHAGSQMTVAVKKTLGKENITYQWQENGKDISGATMNPYNIPTGKPAGTYTYRCKVTCGGYSIFSNAAVVNIGKASFPNVKPESTMTVPNTATKVGDVSLPDGWVWHETDKAKDLVPDAAVVATAVYNGEDKGNYENVSMTITITRKSCQHDWDEGVITQNVTSDKNGVRTYTCKTCKETREEYFSAPSKGKKYPDDKNSAIYTVTKAGLTGGTVTYVKPVSDIAEVTIPATVTINGVKFKVSAIGKNAFSGSKNLKKVKIGKNITNIGDKAFYKCVALKQITIPAKVSKIGKNAFYGCKKLSSITINTTKLTAQKVGKNAFKGIKSTATIKVPKSKFKSYKTMLRKKGIGTKAKFKK